MDKKNKPIKGSKIIFRTDIKKGKKKCSRTYYGKMIYSKKPKFYYVDKC